MTDQQNPPASMPPRATPPTPAVPASVAAPAPVVTPAPAVPPSAAPSAVTVTQNVVAVRQKAGPGLLVRALWFFFIGTWLSALSIGIAYVLCVTIIGLPLAFVIFNRIPTILTLRPRTDIEQVEVLDGITYVRGATVKQRPTWIRALWFVFVGIWIGIPYVSIAWLLCVILVTLPLGIWMLDRLGAVMTLLRH